MQLIHDVLLYEVKWSEAISLSPRGFSGLIYNTLWGTLARLLVTQFTINFKEVKDAPVKNRNILVK